MVHHTCRYTHSVLLTSLLRHAPPVLCVLTAVADHAGNDLTDMEVEKLIVVTSAKKGSKQQLDQQLIDDGLALYQEQLAQVQQTSWHGSQWSESVQKVTTTVALV